MTRQLLGAKEMMSFVGCSPHVSTGLWGLALLSLQGMLSLFFDEEPSLRTAHAFLGTSIMALGPRISRIAIGLEHLSREH